jgi:hypothetical protein
VLHEVELLVAGGGPEVVALDGVFLGADTLPSSPTMVVLLFLPKGGLASTTSKRSPGSAASASPTTTGTDFSGANAVQHQVHRAQPRRGLHQLPAA